MPLKDPTMYEHRHILLLSSFVRMLVMCDYHDDATNPMLVRKRGF